MRGVIPPLPNTLSWRDTQLKHRDNFTFTLPSQKPATGPIVSQFYEFKVFTPYLSENI